MVSQRSFAAGTGAVALLAAQAAAQQFVMYTPGGDDTVVQRMDAIISPGKLSQHVHQFFGANNISPDMSYESLQDSSCTTVGAANGHWNAQDMSSYWHPALYMEAKDGSGYIRIPTNGHKMYYLDHGSTKDQKREPFEFPTGFRMVANGPFARAPNPDKQKQAITQWICHTPSDMNLGPGGGFPKNVDDCSAYPGFNGAINFPHCWNGNDYDVNNPTAHTAYPDGDVNFGPCPSTHPIRLPHLFIENQFDLHKMVDKVKPNTFTLAQGDTTGYGWHMDFFNGWKTGALAHLLTNEGCQQGKYGNEDIGGCGGFVPGAMSKDCKLTKTFTENVDTPGQFLPGCNPISLLNPAPIMAVAALGVSTDQCSAAGSGGSSPAPAYPTSAASSAPAASAPASSATTLATMPKPTSASTSAATVAPASTSSAPSYGGNHGSGFGGSSGSSGSALCPDQDGQSFTDPTSGKTFTVECNTDHQGGDLDMTFVPVGSGALAACIAACAANSQCIDVSLSGAACYLKKSLGDAKKHGFVDGAKLASATAAAPSATSSPASMAAAAAAPTTTAAPAAYGGNNRVAAAGAAPDGSYNNDSDPNVIVVTVTDTADPVRVTEWVTVYAPEPTGAHKREEPAIHARHGHAHMHLHADSA